MKKIVSRSRFGFTLIELLIVIVILGILSVAFLPTVLDAPKKARDATRKTHINSIVQAIQTSVSVDGNAVPNNIYAAAAGLDAAAAAVAKTFPNNAFPVDPQGAKYSYKFDSSRKCMMISAKVEIPETNGNSFEDVAVLSLEACKPNPKTTSTELKENVYYVVTLQF